MIGLDNLPPPPTKNAMTPILWLTSITAVLVIPATPFLPLWAAIVGWVVFIAIVMVALWSYIHFVKTDPAQLRSEDHALKLAALNVYNQAPERSTGIARIISTPTMSIQRYLKGPDHG